MIPEEKVENLYLKFERYTRYVPIEFKEAYAKQCALIAVENEYKALREQLFNLRSCKVIENEKVYLTRLQQLIDEENQVKQELEKL